MVQIFQGYTIVTSAICCLVLSSAIVCASSEDSFSFGHQTTVDYQIFQSFSFQTTWSSPTDDETIDLTSSTFAKENWPVLRNRPSLHQANSDLIHSGIMAHKQESIVGSDKSVYRSNVIEDQEWRTYIESFLKSWKELVREIREDEEDDDDDDELDNDGEDGSCSMLSNASLDRSNKEETKESQVHVAIFRQQRQSNVEQDSKKKIKQNKRKLDINCFDTSVGKAARPSALSLQRTTASYGLSLNSRNLALLGIRGGAEVRATSPPSFGTEVTKRLFVSAIVTLLFEWSFGHIFEFVKIDMQTNNSEEYTYSDSIRSTTSEKGIGGLWDGFIPWGFVQAIFKGSVFGLVSVQPDDDTDGYTQLTHN